MRLSESRVLHVITRSHWGGAPKIVKYLSTESPASVAVACGPGGKLVDELRNEGVPVYVVDSLQSPPNPIQDAKSLYRITTLVRELEPDLVHCHSTKAGVLARIAARLNDVPSVFTVHGWGFYNTEYDFMGSVIRRGERTLARLTDGFVLVSENDAEAGMRYDITADTPSRVIHNGVSEWRAEDEGDLFGELPIDPDKPIIGSVCRLSHQKDPLEMLEVANRLADRSIDFEMIIAGDGPLMDDCRRFVEHNDLETVHLLGFRSDLGRVLSTLDVFLMTSRFEGFPLTLLEAMHVGIPIVSYDVGGVREAVKGGETGYVVERGNTGAFTERTARLVEDDAMRERFANASRRTARDEFTVDRMVSEYRTFYRELVAAEREGIAHPA
ncbi:glycosyltransferase family 4 protein [Natronococcus pandeyae]|nr:glycosyltransferase family 4 protein [Natronococcus pandeyae]